MRFLLSTILMMLSVVAHAACPDGSTYPIHFTFDDGPSTTLTPQVLDILRDEGVPSTFFVLGSNLPGGRRNPANRAKYAIMDRMKNEGHRIGSHTYEHIQHNSTDFTQQQVRNNIRQASQVLQGYESRILRLPYGAGSFNSSNPEVQRRNNMVMSEVRSAGYTHAGWDVDTNDWSAQHRPTLQQTMLNQICSNCKKKSQGACVVLFHDVQANTAQNLRTWIRAVKSAGHRFVPIENDRRYEDACRQHVSPALEQTMRDFDAIGDLIERELIRGRR